MKWFSMKWTFDQMVDSMLLIFVLMVRCRPNYTNHINSGNTIEIKSFFIFKSHPHLSKTEQSPDYIQAAKIFKIFEF
jgi:hypothetical protein